MITSNRKSAGRSGVRRAGIVATALGASAAALALAAPAASAAVTSINVNPGALNSRVGTGCTVEVTAGANGPVNEPVYFYDADGSWSTSATVSGGKATVKWTPTTPGQHTLRAYQFGPYGVMETLVQVGNGINLGSVCVVL
ncbi:Ig-like domain repeat protein [Aldersonia kunmingensis]|uniref:Ig-like domain repeat protein n=1 Tax=Aldersonia kunmingensis TaxID=408066 RepID=UPI00082F4FD2|nr:Ig-like domain repeat protein [Aldersonia kunmingensis]